MNRKLLLLFLLSSVYFPSFSQDQESIDDKENPSTKYAIGITGGIGGLVVRDQVISNFLYSGSYKHLGFHFEILNPYNKSYFRLEFMNSPTFHTKTNEGFSYKGDLGEFFPNETNGLDFSTIKAKSYSLNYTQLYLLRATEHRKIKFYLGYDFTYSRFQKTFLQFASTNKLTDLVYSLGLALNVERNFNEKHHLEYNLSIPIISHASRRLVNPDADPTSVSQQKFTVLASVMGFDSRFTYRLQVSKHFSLRAIYSFRYLQVTFPQKEQWAYNQGVLGVYFHF